MGEGAKESRKHICHKLLGQPTVGLFWVKMLQTPESISEFYTDVKRPE